MGKDDKTRDLPKERAYLSAQLEEATKELARLDLLNLTLTQERRRAIAAFQLIRIIQEKIEKALTVDDLYSNVVKALTVDLFMDASALLRINYKTRDLHILASEGLPKNIKCLKLDKNISKQQLLKPTFVNSKSFPKVFHKFLIKRFKFPYFVWYPIIQEEDSVLVLFVGNRFEDFVKKQSFSSASLETFGAISSVILLRRENIIHIQEILRSKEERIDYLAEIIKTSPVPVIATDWDAKITYANPAIEKLYGYKTEELIGKNPDILNAEPNAAEIQREILDTVSKRKIWRGEILNKKKSGDLFYVYVSIYQLTDNEGNFIAFVGFHEDITERKKAEEALRESQQLLERMFDSLHDAVLIIDADTVKIKDCNIAASKVFGYSRAEMLGRTTAFLHVDNASLEKFRKHLYHAIEEKGFLHQLDFMMKRKDGTIFYTEHSVTPLEDEKGRRIGWVSIIRDITERKRAKEELKESETRYRTLADSIADIFFEMDKDLTYTYWNKASENLTGIKAKDAIGKSLYDIFSDSPDTRRAEKVYLDVLRTKQPRSFVNEFRIGDKDYIFEISAYPSERGLSVLAKDITERKQVEKALKIKDKAIASSLNAITIAELGGNLTYVNSSFLRMWGYDNENEVLGKPAVEFWFSKEKAWKVIEELHNRGSWTGEMVARRKDGSFFDVQLSAITVTDEIGEPTCMMASFEDVTERKDSEEKIRRYQEQLQSLVSELSLAEERERRRFATELHDHVGQILATIKIKSGELRELTSSSQLIGHVDEIRNLIEQAIQYTRSLTFQLSPPILYELGLTEAIEWLAERIQKEHGIFVDVEEDKHSKPLDNDICVLLFQTIRELMINIVKHAKAHKAKVSIRRNGDDIRITVQDDGIGFETSKSSLPLHRKEGFGLFSIRERICHLGGRLDIESEHERGTRVTIVAPLKVKKNSSVTE